MASTRVAVVTGAHPYDVPAFHALFRALPEVDCYIQNMEEFCTSEPAVRAAYDTVLFYNMHMAVPSSDNHWSGQPMKTALESLGESRQGILVLHHALLAFPQWPLWSSIVGIEDRRFGYYHDEALHIEVARKDHPITQGFVSWDTVDESYTMNDAGTDSEVLLTTEHPRSMKTIAWTRHYRQARVFCLELGHDNSAFADPHFRTLVARGLQWCAGKL
jgi:uncharacterized protein